MKNPFQGLSVHPAAKASLHPLDEANYLRQSVEKWGNVIKVAFMLDVSPSWVYDRLRLLTLDVAAQKAFRSGALSLTQASEIARLAPQQHAAAMALGNRSARDLKRRIKCL